MLRLERVMHPIRGRAARKQVEYQARRQADATTQAACAWGNCGGCPEGASHALIHVYLFEMENKTFTPMYGWYRSACCANKG